MDLEENTKIYIGIYVTCFLQHVPCVIIVLYFLDEAMNPHYQLHYKRNLILDAFVKLRKATISFFMSVCPSVLLAARMEQLGSHWTDFREI
jgi:hypothetical protein